MIEMLCTAAVLVGGMVAAVVSEFARACEREADEALADETVAPQQLA